MFSPSLLSAYLLVSHGSRDRRPLEALEQLAELVVAQMTPKLAESRSRNIPLVGTATLELAPLPLHEQICQFSGKALALGCDRVQVLPLFLLAGTHVMADIPREVAIAQQVLGDAIALELRSHLGTAPSLLDLFAQQQAAIAAPAWILLAHGSSQPGCNQAIAATAAQLNAVPAYWSVPQSLEQQIESLAVIYPKIGILPYFLFAGGIAGAIAQKVTDLQSQFPQTQLLLGETIGSSAALAKIVLSLLQV